MNNIIVGDESYYFDNMPYLIIKIVFHPMKNTIYINYFLFYFLFIKILNYHLAHLII